MSRGSFFAIDVPTFDAVCKLDDANAAAAYLILAAGTGPDNRTSSWAREAINQRTCLNWRRAADAVGKLEKSGLVRWLTEKATRKPRIDLTPTDNRSAGHYARELVRKLREGHQPARNAHSAIRAAELAGLIERGPDGQYRYIEPGHTALAWLPMSLVGDAKGRPVEGQPCIVEQLRKARDPMVFHLLVHLAYRQELAEHGGIDRVHLWKTFERKAFAKTPQFAIWHFLNGAPFVRWTADMAPHFDHGEDEGKSFFERVRVLEDAGALEWVHYLAEDDASDSILIHPAGVVRHGKLVHGELESVVGCYAVAAGCALAGKSGDFEAWFDAMPAHLLLPVDRMNRRAAVVGVPRLRGKARTRNAERWQQERCVAAREWISTFRGILAETSPELLARVDARNADFNVEFNATSTLPQRDINDSCQSAMHNPSFGRAIAGEEEAPNDSENRRSVL